MDSDEHYLDCNEVLAAVAEKKKILLIANKRNKKRSINSTVEKLRELFNNKPINSIDEKIFDSISLMLLKL